MAGRNAVLPPGAGTFSNGENAQGLIEQLDLVIGENFTEWSQRVFGSVVSQTRDADGDGRTNHEEYLAGTDPQDPGSLHFVCAVTPTGPGGLTISWDSLAGRRSSVRSSPNLQTWTNVRTNIPGTGNVLSFTDPDISGKSSLFYRSLAVPEL